jgi:chloramphenicol-sensitive protein RarD
MGEKKESTAGLTAALVAFLIWGLVPVYFKALEHLPVLELTAHRAVWSVLFVGMLVLGFSRAPVLLRLLGRPRQLVPLCLTSALLTLNWGIFIWAVNNGQIVAASLGYFIAPLSNVVLGVVLLGERLTSRQTAAVLLAAAGVGTQVLALGELPWVSLAIPATWSAYALVRKRTGIDPITGLFVEMTIIAPFFLAYLIWLGSEGGFLTVSLRQDLLLATGGIVTAVPLVLFTFAAQRLGLATVGIIQYLAPTANFLLGVVVYGEPFGPGQMVSFGLIWLALALYTSEGLKRAPAAASQAAR